VKGKIFFLLYLWQPSYNTHPNKIFVFQFFVHKDFSIRFTIVSYSFHSYQNISDVFFPFPILLIIFLFSRDLRYLNAVVGETLSKLTHSCLEIWPFSLINSTIFLSFSLNSLITSSEILYFLKVTTKLPEISSNNGSGNPWSKQDLIILFVPVPHSSINFIKKKHFPIRGFLKIDLCFFFRSSIVNGFGKGPTPHTSTPSALDVNNLITAGILTLLVEMRVKIELLWQDFKKRKRL